MMKVDTLLTPGTPFSTLLARVLTALLVAAALVLAGCGSPPSTSDAPSANGSQPSGNGAGAQSAGSVTEFPTSVNALIGITAGPDGNLWFTYDGGIGRMTPAGKVTTFPLPSSAKPAEITAGPDGNLWFTNAGGIGRMTTSGQFTEFPTSYGVRGITKGADGNVWFTGGGGIGQITHTHQANKQESYILTTAGRYWDACDDA